MEKLFLRVFFQKQIINSNCTGVSNFSKRKKVTSEELVKIALAITKRENPTLNAVITLREEAALTEAKALQDTGQPFLGVPLLLKGLGQLR